MVDPFSVLPIRNMTFSNRTLINYSMVIFKHLAWIKKMCANLNIYTTYNSIAPSFWQTANIIAAKQLYWNTDELLFSLIFIRYLKLIQWKYKSHTRADSREISAPTFLTTDWINFGIKIKTCTIFRFIRC